MAQKVDIVLVKANNQRNIYQDLSEDLSGIEPPLWLILTAAYLRKEGFSVAAVDAEADNLTTEQTVERVKGYDPLLAAVIVFGANPSASTMNMPAADDVIWEIKKTNPEIVTAISGLHPSALPRQTLEHQAADFVVAGEGFLTYAELLKALKDGKTKDDDLPIKGLWYKRKGKIVSHEFPVNIPDLGELPMPAWDLLSMKKYRAHNWHCFEHIDQRRPYAVIYTSLGCPFSCSFCCINAPFGKPGIRHRPPKKVVEEVDYLVKNYGIRDIKIIDELFISKWSHVEEICDGLIALGHHLNFWVYGRVDTVKDRILAKMKKAGINWIAYGIEAGSKKVRDGVDKGRFDQQKIREVIQMTHEAGIHIVANFIFGLPDDDFQTMKETLNLALELNCEYTNFYCAMAYPGSKLYGEAIQRGWTLPPNWQGYSQFGEESFPLPTKYLSNGEVLAFRDFAFDTYHNNPKYLDMMLKKFGAKAVEHIRKMCSVQLKRKYATPISEDIFKD